MSIQRDQYGPDGCSQDLRSEERCNCESIHCDHGTKACGRDSDSKRLLYIGRVCDICYVNVPLEYRV